MRNVPGTLYGLAANIEGGAVPDPAYKRIQYVSQILIKTTFDIIKLNSILYSTIHIKYAPDPLPAPDPNSNIGCSLPFDPEAPIIACNNL